MRYAARNADDNFCSSGGINTPTMVAASVARLVAANQEFGGNCGALVSTMIIADDQLAAMAKCKNGVSSYEIMRDLGVTQKTAWFMLHRIRLAMREDGAGKLGGSGREVEADETFIGGKSRVHAQKFSRQDLEI